MSEKGLTSLAGFEKQGLCSSTWETALGTKHSHQLTPSKDTGPQSYNHKVLDSANNLNVLRSISECAQKRPLKRPAS